jgi:hypothetical protein
MTNATYDPFKGQVQGFNPRKEFSMAYRTILSIAAAAVFGIAGVSTDALAYYRGGGRVGGYHGAYRGAWRGGYARPGWGVGVGVGAAAIGAAAVGAAIAAPNYYNTVTCGYYPYPPCY